MLELVQILWLVLGIVGAPHVDSNIACAEGACPAVPARPVVAWSAPQNVRADEVRLFSRAERRPGEPGPVLVLSARGEGEIAVVEPASIRLRTVLITRGR